MFSIMGMVYVSTFNFDILTLAPSIWEVSLTHQKAEKIIESAFQVDMSFDRGAFGASSVRDAFAQVAVYADDGPLRPTLLSSVAGTNLRSPFLMG